MPSFMVALHDKIYYIYAQMFPKRRASRLFYDRFGEKLNWVNPQNYTAKGRWIQFNTDTSMWSMLADKYNVRQHLENLGLSSYLVKCYGSWTGVDEIDFTKLPQSFVIKTNHGSGEVVVVKDKSRINIDEIKDVINHYLHTPYGVMSAEPHYLKIKPMVLVEQLLENTSSQSSSMIDYKIFCVYGKPIIIDVCYDRDSQAHHLSETWYTPDWRNLGSFLPYNQMKDIQRPNSLLKMYDICKVIASNLPLVRIDFYDVSGKPYIGEVTMTPSGFDGDSLSEEGEKILFNAIQLP